jgi:hypothetical protein
MRATETTFESLTARVVAFIKDRKKSEGGFASVTPKEIDDLYDIIADLISLKYESDPDGDLPVRVRLVDWTRFEPEHWFLVPHSKFGEEDDKIAVDRLRSMLINLEMATKALERHVRIGQDGSIATPAERTALLKLARADAVFAAREADQRSAMNTAAANLAITEQQLRQKAQELADAEETIQALRRKLAEFRKAAKAPRTNG